MKDSRKVMDLGSVERKETDPEIKNYSFKYGGGLNLFGACQSAAMGTPTASQGKAFKFYK